MRRGREIGLNIYTYFTLQVWLQMITNGLLLQKSGHIHNPV